VTAVSLPTLTSVTAANLFLLGVVATVTFFASLILVVIVLSRLPATFFLDSHDRGFWIDHHPLLRITAIVLKNLLGIAIVAFGLFLSVPGIPGQGILTILLGLVLIDFPRKRKWERKLLGIPRIRRAVDHLRRRAGRPPFLLELADDKNE